MLKWLIGLVVVSNVAWWLVWKRERQSGDVWARVALRMALGRKHGQ